MYSTKVPLYADSDEDDEYDDYNEFNRDLNENERAEIAKYNGDKDADFISLAEAHLNNLLEMSSQTDQQLHAQSQKLDTFWNSLHLMRGGNASTQPINVPACLPPFKREDEKESNSVKCEIEHKQQQLARPVLHSNCAPILTYEEIVAAGNRCFKLEQSLRHEMCLRKVIDQLRKQISCPMQRDQMLQVLTTHGMILREQPCENRCSTIIVVSIVGMICLHCALDQNDYKSMLTLRGFLLVSATI